MNITGKYIKITKRNAHPNLQPQSVKEGDILRVVETRGDKLLVTHELKHNVRGKVYTINPKRFEWKAYTDVKCLVQDLTALESERVIQRMTTELSEEEIIKVAIVPLIIERVAWSHCQTARDNAAKERVEITKKLSRTFIDLKETYDRGLREHLGKEQIQLISNITDAFMNEYATDFTKLFFTVDNLFLKKYPDGKHREVRVHGIIAKLLTKTAQVYRRRADQAILVSKGIVDKPTGGEYKIVQALYDVADAYAGEDGIINYDDYNLQNALKFFLIKLDEIRCNPETKEIEL